MRENQSGGIRNNKKIINMKNINFYTVEYWQENWDELMGRVEDGEVIGIENSDTEERAVMIPMDHELMQQYREMNNEAP